MVDRIFTRIGASDSLLEGKSTFYVEMEETHNIIDEATFNSICILDELGRGTATFDGVSIAYSILKCLSDYIECRVIFATHYHLLVEEFHLYPNIGQYFMDC